MAKKTRTVTGGVLGTLFEVIKLPFSVCSMVLNNTKESLGSAKSKVKGWNSNIRNFSVKGKLEEESDDRE